MLALVMSNSAVLPQLNNLKLNFQLWHLRADLYLLKDSLGIGNMLICDSPRGLVIVDAKTEACYPMLQEFLVAQFQKDISFVINTHCHPGHAGGNIGLCGKNQQIIAHYKTAEHLLKTQKLAVLDEAFAALPPPCQPNCLISGALKLNLQTESITITPIGGHTDGDLAVFYRDANAVHAGGLCSFGSFPYIGINEGGSVDDMLDGLRKLHMVLSDSTIVVPGHGEPGTRKQLADYIEKLQKARDNMLDLINKNAELDEVFDSAPAKDLAENCYNDMGPLNQMMFEELLYLDLSRKAAKA